MIFKSNQGTNDHLKNELNSTNIRPYASGKITGIISDEPKIVKGGHVFFSILSDGYELRCAVYKPTGMSSVALSLIKGDKVCLGGGIRKASKNYPRILNLEFIDVINLEKNLIKSNSVCKKCDKKMKSLEKSKNNCIFLMFLHIDILADHYKELEELMSQNLMNQLHGFAYMKTK